MRSPISFRRPCAAIGFLGAAAFFLGSGGCESLTEREQGEQALGAGRQAYLAKDFARAVKICTEAEKEYLYSKTEARILRAEVYEAWGKHDEALADQLHVVECALYDKQLETVSAFIARTAERIRRESEACSSTADYDAPIATLSRYAEKIVQVDVAVRARQSRHWKADLSPLTELQSQLLSRRLKEDLVELSRALDTTPDRAEVRLRRATVRMEIDARNLGTPALEDLARAEALLPGDIRIPLLRGEILMRLDRSDEARESFRRAWTTDPGNAAANHELGMLEGDRTKGLRYFEQAISSAPGVARYYEGRARFLWRGLRDGTGVESVDRDQVIKDCSRWIALTPETRWIDCSPAYLMRAACRIDNADYKAVVGELNEYAERIVRPNPVMHFLNGVHRLKTGYYSDAVYHFDKAIEAGWGTSAAYEQRCSAWCNIGDVVRAKEDFQKAKQLNPNVKEPDWTNAERRAREIQHEKAERDAAARFEADRKTRIETEKKARLKAEQEAATRARSNARKECPVCRGIGVVYYWGEEVPTGNPQDQKPRPLLKPVTVRKSIKCYDCDGKGYLD